MNSDQIKKMKESFVMQDISTIRAETTLHPNETKDKINRMCRGLNLLVEYVEFLEKRIEELEKK